MKDYPKNFEDIYSIDSKINKKVGKFSFDKYKVSNDTFDNQSEYIDLFRKQFKKFEIEAFDSIVKIIWLAKRFNYDGKNRNKLRRNGYYLDKAFTLFMRDTIKFSLGDITRNHLYCHIISYFYDLFPDFDVNNPFNNPEYYRFPYKNISFSYLNFVYQVDDRLELLKMADEREMKLSEFYDYVTNHINSINNKCKNDIYGVYHTNYGLPYIKKGTEVDFKKNKFCINCEAKLKYNQKKFCSVVCQQEYQDNLRKKDGNK